MRELPPESATSANCRIRTSGCDPELNQKQEHQLCWLPERRLGKMRKHGQVAAAETSTSGTEGFPKNTRLQPLPAENAKYKDGLVLSPSPSTLPQFPN